MMSFLKSKKGLLCILSALLFLIAAGLGGYEIWHYQQVKFHDLTIELGTDTVSINDFMTEYARPKKVGFVSDVSVIDLNKVGETELTLSHGRQQETVILKIQDTTAPTAEFTTEAMYPINALPTAKELVSNVEDFSKTEIYFAEEIEIPEDYHDVTVTLVVEDAHGNKTEEDCLLSFQWMWGSYTLELGDELKKEDLLLDPEKDEALIEQTDLDAINESPIGEYTLLSATKSKEQTCSVLVQDTRGPELVLKDVQRFLNKSAKLEDFVVSATDPSGDVELRLVTTLDFGTLGSYPVTIEAEDIHGNITSAEATLFITTDVTPPKISGLDMLSVAKNSTPNYLKGVSAEDKVDGACKVTCDSSGVDLTKAGTYYAVYKAVDKSGNVASARRSIFVIPDDADINALVESIGANLSNDPEALRNYVRDSIGYSSNWGGDAPVWYGFTNKVGNCYVHALCLKALFDLKGIENQLIWVTNKSHYWLIVKIDGIWLHIDPTPSALHGKYSLMNDAMRYSTLSGRNWDRTQWPACG